MRAACSCNSSPCKDAEYRGRRDETDDVDSFLPSETMLPGSVPLELRRVGSSSGKEIVDSRRPWPDPFSW